jgi:hypothetical protein
MPYTSVSIHSPFRANGIESHPQFANAAFVEDRPRPNSDTNVVREEKTSSESPAKTQAPLGSAVPEGYRRP